MDFDFTPEQQLFRDSVRAFAGELAPGYLERAKATAFPWDIAKRMGRLGHTGLMISQEWGGSGADGVTLGIAAEEIGRVDVNLAYITFASVVGSTLIERFGGNGVKQALIPGLVSGEKIVAVALTEPGAGSDAASLATKAVRVDDGWLISGEKTSVSGVEHASAFVVLARTDPDSRHGISAFIVPANSPGISRQRFLDHGFRPFGRGAIALNDVVVPNDHLLGEEGAAFPMIMNTFDFTRALIGLICVSCAGGALEEAIEYAKLRTTFGRSIAMYQGVAFPLAEHATLLEAARWLCYRTLWLRDAGRPHSKEAAMCKWWCPRLARDALHDCLLTFGHVAYSQEHSVGQKLRDVMAFEIGDGTAQIQKLIIAREMFGREFTPS